MKIRTTTTTQQKFSLHYPIGSEFCVCNKPPSPV